MTEMFRRYADDGAAIADLAPLAGRPGSRHPHREGPVGPVGDLGHAPQPRLRGHRRLRQDPGRPRAGRAEPHRPPCRAHRPPAGQGRGPAERGMDRDPRPRPRRRGDVRPGPAAAGRQQAVRRPQHEGPVPAAGPGRLRVLRLRLLPHLHHDQFREEDLLLPLPRLRRLPLPGRPGLPEQASPRRLRRHGRLGPRHRPARRPRPHPRRDQQAAGAGPAPPTPSPASAASSSRPSPRRRPRSASMVTAFSEQLITIDELRARMPAPPRPRDRPEETSSPPSTPRPPTATPTSSSPTTSRASSPGSAQNSATATTEDRQRVLRAARPGHPHRTRENHHPPPHPGPGTSQRRRPPRHHNRHGG